MRSINSDKYCYTDSDTLINKLGILDSQILDDVVNKSVSLSTFLLYTPPILIDGFKTLSSRYNITDIGFFRDLHVYLFKPFYEWAGRYRETDVAVEYDHVAYEKPENISYKMKAVFQYIKNNNGFKDCPYGEKIQNLALVYGNLKNLQPFRDGNTRTSMLYTQFLANSIGFYIDYDLANEREFKMAEIRARDNDYNDIVMQFATIAIPIEDVSKKLLLPKLCVDREGKSVRKHMNELISCN